MFKEFYNPGEQKKQEDLSVPEQGRLSAIASLMKNTQDLRLSISVRIVRTKALIQLLKEELIAHPSNTFIKIDLAEAENRLHELQQDAAANDPSVRKRA